MITQRYEDSEFLLETSPQQATQITWKKGEAKQIVKVFVKSRGGDTWKVRSHIDKLNWVADIQVSDFARYQALPTRCTVF